MSSRFAKSWPLLVGALLAGALATFLTSAVDLNVFDVREAPIVVGVGVAVAILVVAGAAVWFRVTR